MQDNDVTIVKSLFTSIDIIFWVIRTNEMATSFSWKEREVKRKGEIFNEFHARSERAEGVAVISALVINLYYLSKWYRCYASA